MKKKKTLRQAMEVSPQELRNLANELTIEFEDTLRNINCLEDYTKEQIAKKKFLVPIINKQPECSDTWTFEGD